MLINRHDGNRIFYILIGVLISLVLAAIIVPYLSSMDPRDASTFYLENSHLPPSFMPGGNRKFLLGTDSQGADMVPLIFYGLRTSLLIGFFAVAVSLIIGGFAGLIGGYAGGLLDAAIMRCADVQFTFPALLMALLMGTLGHAMLSDFNRERYAFITVVLSLGIAHWPHFARLIRSRTQVEVGKDYVSAARMLGRGPIFIIMRHLLPNVCGSVIILATLDLSLTIMSEATLSFLGFGMPESEPSLGTMIRTGYEYVFSGEWWMVAFPGLVLVVLTVTINLLGDRVRDTLSSTG